jgi:hypothetical protein
MGGQITTMFSDALPAMQNMKSGKLRALAVTSAERWPHTPELPTLAEEGVKGFAAVNWWGILVPAGTPRPIIDKMAGDLAKALANPGVKSALAVLGVEAISSTPEQFGAFMASEQERWTKLIKEQNLESRSSGRTGRPARYARRNTTSHTWWPSFSPRLSNFVSGRCSGRGANPRTVLASSGSPDSASSSHCA